jgi:hypothetical protein
MKLWSTDAFSMVADVCSIGSLVLTGLITVTAAKVRRQYLDKVLYPKHLEALQRHCENLRQCLLEYSAAGVLISREVGQIEGSLQSLRRELRRQHETASVDAALQSLKNYGNSRTESSLKEVYTQMNRVMQEIQNKITGI